MAELATSTALIQAYHRSKQIRDRNYFKYFEPIKLGSTSQTRFRFQYKALLIQTSRIQIRHITEKAKLIQITQYQGCIPIKIPVNKPARYVKSELSTKVRKFTPH